MEERNFPGCVVGETLIQRDSSGLKVYGRRWYILALFTAIAGLFNMFWNTWGPIQAPCNAVFGWSDTDILLLSLWAGVAFTLATPPFLWLMDAKGIRISAIICLLLMVTGKLIQCIPLKTGVLRTAVINAGQFIIMLSAPMPMGAAPLISATWFPPHQRTTSTAIGSLGGYLGTAVGFTIGPAMVPFSNQTGNSTHDMSVVEGRILHYFWLEAGVAAFLLFLILVYFPNKPPSPPSISSSTNHLSGRAGFLFMLRNRSFWVIGGLCGLNFGVYFGWVSVLDVILSKFDVDEKTAGWLGCSTTLVGILPGIMLARLADYIQHKTKQIIVFILTCTVVSQVVFTLSCLNILPSTNAVLFTAIISAGFFFNGTVPLFLELCVECAYPVDEGMPGIVANVMGNIVLLIFYGAFMLPHSDVGWMNWVLSAGIGISIPILLIYRQKYPRLDMDTVIVSEESDGKDEAILQT